VAIIDLTGKHSASMNFPRTATETGPPLAFSVFTYLKKEEKKRFEKKVDVLKRSGLRLIHVRDASHSLG
jgi:hypothetical protein